MISAGAEIINNEDPESFQLNKNVVINLLRVKSKDFYWLIVDKKYEDQQTGAKRWNQTVAIDKTNWTTEFKSVQKTCRENKVRKFHFKFIHRIVVTKKELFRFNIQSDSNFRYILRAPGVYRPYLFGEPVYKVLYSRSNTMV